MGKMYKIRYGSIADFNKSDFYGGILNEINSNNYGCNSRKPVLYCIISLPVSLEMKKDGMRKIYGVRMF